MAVSLYKFTEGVIRKRQTGKFPSINVAWKYWKALLGCQILEPSLSKPSLGTLVGQRPMLSWSSQSTWTCRLPCRGPVVQDLAPFTRWPEQSRRDIPSFQLAGSRWQQTVARLCSSKSVKTVGGWQTLIPMLCAASFIRMKAVLYASRLLLGRRK